MKINLSGGTGEMGRIHKPIFEAAGHEVILSGRKTSPGLEEAAKQTDLTIVSVPIGTTEERIKRVAPYCSAIMDFTGVKEMPINAMLKYSNPDCEVAGLHPLYGDVSEGTERTVIYCPTERIGEKVHGVLDSFIKSGINIRGMTPAEHDRAMEKAQNARTEVLEMYARQVMASGLSFRDFYTISPPPTRVILDLIARQFDEKNDGLYSDMSEFNQFHQDTLDSLFTQKKYPSHTDETRKKVREYFGDELKNAQKRAAKLI
jgi:prephenate dehydrogenase